MVTSRGAPLRVRVPTRISRSWSRALPGDFSGLLVGLLFFCGSLTASLLPRSWILQGIVSGIVVGLGYGLGVLVGHLVGRVVPWRPGPTARRIGWRLFLGAGAVVAVIFLRLGFSWQQQIHQLLGEGHPATFSYMGTALLAFLVFGVLVQLGRSLRWLQRRIAVALHRWLRPGVAQAVATVVAAALVVGVLDGVVFRGFLDAADGLSRAVDEAMSDDTPRPRNGTRSGGPDSLVVWEQLGSKGREFIAGGPTAADIEAFSRRPSKEPVRVYVGLGAADDERDRAAIAVEELERAGGFDRAVLCVIVPTGTGWINPTAAAALEYLHDGDSALVAMQYGYLPSWLSYLVDTGRARDAGRELFNQVYERWVKLPVDDRPLLVVYGESLGSHGSEAAFSGIADLRQRSDGALWVGPANFNTLWRELTSHRDPGSAERLPVYEGGRTVRFAATPADLTADTTAWPRPRVVYLQHASDPVVWWSPNLLLRSPDWLREPRGDDVLESVRWLPIVTFTQVTVDLLNGYTLDVDGFGHRYDKLVVDGWVAVAPPTGDWSGDDTARLKRALDAHQPTPPP